MSGRREVSSAGGGGGGSLTLSQYLFLKWSLPILKPGVHRSPPVRRAPQHGPESGSEGSSGSRGGGWAVCWKLEASRSLMSKKSADAVPVGSGPPRGKVDAIPFVRSSHQTFGGPIGPNRATEGRGALTADKIPG